MKTIIVVVALALLVAVPVYAATALRVTTKWAEVNATAQDTEVYRVNDVENGVICYFGYIKKNGNTPPVVSCVKL